MGGWESLLQLFSLWPFILQRLHKIPSLSRLSHVVDPQKYMLR